MTEKLPPISPHQSSPLEDWYRKKNKIKKTSRIVKITFVTAIILFFGVYTGRAYYLTKYAQPNPLMDEFQGSYCCSCEKGIDPNGHTIRETLLLKPKLIFFPLLEISWKPLYVSASWQPPDGSATKVKKFVYDFSDHLGACFNCANAGYFYASRTQIELIMDNEHVTLIPIRWGEAKFLIESNRIADFCRGPVIASQCFYADSKSIKGKPVYLDGTLVCPAKK